MDASARHCQAGVKSAEGSQVKEKVLNVNPFPTYLKKWGKSSAPPWCQPARGHQALSKRTADA
jgi:hypothetical protein